MGAEVNQTHPQVALNRGARRYSFRGKDHAGAGVTGSMELTPAQLTEWVRRRFRRGWWWLEVHYGEHLVGAVDDGSLLGKRTWWTE